MISPEEAALVNGAKFQEIEPSQMIDYQRFHPRMLSAFQLPSSYVLQLPKGQVYGEKGIVITTDDKVIEDTCFEYGTTPDKHPVWSKLLLPKVRPFKGRLAVIAYPGARCYYHWMVEILPRFETLRRSGVAVDAYYVPPIERPYIDQTLAKLGLDRDKFVYANLRDRFEADTLVLPSTPARDSHAMVAPWVISWLRETFLPKGLAAAKKRSYISRKQATTRRILNEEQLWALLESLGFEKVYLEDLLVEDQVKLFAQSSCIVAPHGAGLTNLIFASPGTKVIEMFPGEVDNFCYSQLASQLKLNYQYFVADLMEGDDNPNVRDLKVDINNLQEQLEALL